MSKITFIKLDWSKFNDNAMQIINNLGLDSAYSWFTDCVNIKDINEKANMLVNEYPYLLD